MGIEPRQTTSNIGLIAKPSLVVRNLAFSPLTSFKQALAKGLKKHYYSIVINYRKSLLEQKMLLNLYKKKWFEGMKLEQMDDMQTKNIETMKKMGKLGENYIKWVEQEMEKT